MADSRRPELNLYEIGAISVAVASGCVLVYLKDYSAEVISDVVKDIASLMAVLMPVVLFIASQRNRDIDAAVSDAIGELKASFPGLLRGPTVSARARDAGEEEGYKKYVFVQRHTTSSDSGDGSTGIAGRQAQLFPCALLKEGILQLNVSGTMQQILGNKEQLLELQLRVRASVEAALREAGIDDWEVSEKPINNIAMTLDFDEDNMGANQYRRAIVVAARAALEAMGVSPGRKR